LIYSLFLNFKKADADDSSSLNIDEFNI